MTNIKCIKIGTIDNGHYGRDDYYMLEPIDRDVNIDNESARDFMLTKFGNWMEPSHIGGIFLAGVVATKMASYRNDCMVEVQWRYDV